MWRYRSERFDERCDVEEIAHGGGSVHVWAPFSELGGLSFRSSLTHEQIDLQEDSRRTAIV